MTKRYGMLSVVVGAISIFAFTFLAGIVSMVTAYLGLRSVPNDSASEETRKNLYFCIVGLTLTIIAFLLHSYVF
jgi:hypothetical protein